MPNYVPTDWADGVTPVDEAHLDKIEQGIAAAVPRDSEMAAGASILANKLAVGEQYAYVLYGDGKQNFGAGGAAPVDTSLWRSGAAFLQTNGAFGAGSAVFAMHGDAKQITLNSDGGIYLGNAFDTVIYRSSASQLATAGSFISGSFMSASYQTPSQLIFGDVSLWLGAPADRPGILFGVTYDTNLYRHGVNALKTDGTLNVGGGLLEVSYFSTQYGRVWARQGLPDQVYLGDFDGDAATASIRFGAAGDAYIFRPAAARLETRATLDLNRGPGAPAARTFWNAGEQYPGWQLDRDGHMWWGPGGAVGPDTRLYRSGVNELKTDGNFTAGNLFASGLYSPYFQGGLVHTVNPVSNWAYVSQVNGETDHRLIVYADGKMLWGSGAAGGDTNLYRAGPNYLKTDDYLFVASGMYVRDTLAEQVAIGALNTLVGGGPAAAGIAFGVSGDTYIYRSAASVLASNGYLFPAQGVLMNIHYSAASITLSAGHAGGWLMMEPSSGTVTVTVPTDAVYNFPVGTQITVSQHGAGTVVFQGTGISLATTPGFKLAAQWSVATLVKVAANFWYLTGDLKA